MNDLEQRTTKTADKQIMTTRENVASRLSKLMLNNASSGNSSGSNNSSSSSSGNNSTIAATASSKSMVQSPTSPGEQSELNQLKRDADPQFSRFADYFVICGLDLDTGLEPDRFAGKPHQQNKKSLHDIQKYNSHNFPQATICIVHRWIAPTRANHWPITLKMCPGIRSMLTAFAW